MLLACWNKGSQLDLGGKQRSNVYATVAGTDELALNVVGRVGIALDDDRNGDVAWPPDTTGMASKA